MSSDDTKSYGPYSDADAKVLLQKATAAGMAVTGNGPWDIDAKQHGITLHVTRDASGMVTIKVTGKDFYVGYGKIWDKLNAMMPPASDAVASATTNTTPPPVVPIEHPSAFSKWDDLATALSKLDTGTASVSGATAIHFYPPLPAGEFADMLDDMKRDGWDCSVSTSGRSAKCSHDHNDTQVILADDEEMLRAQVVQATNPDLVWPAIDKYVGAYSAHVVGEDWNPPAPDDSVEAHLSYLQRAGKRITDALDNAKRLEKEAAAKVREDARVAIDKAQALAKQIQAFPDTVVSKAQKAAAQGIDSMLDGAKATATAGGAWLTGAAVFALVWPVAACWVAYELLLKPKRAA